MRHDTPYFIACPKLIDWFFFVCCCSFWSWPKSTRRRSSLWTLCCLARRPPASATSWSPTLSTCSTESKCDAPSRDSRAAGRHLPILSTGTNVLSIYSFLTTEKWAIVDFMGSQKKKFFSSSHLYVFEVAADHESADAYFALSYQLITLFLSFYN